jgi:hypothetical protein
VKKVGEGKDENVYERIGAGYMSGMYMMELGELELLTMIIYFV